MVFVHSIEMFISVLANDYANEYALPWIFPFIVLYLKCSLYDIVCSPVDKQSC